MQRGFLCSFWLLRRDSMMGREKPRVLPVPVLARPTTSRPSSAGARTSAWMGNRASMPRFFRAALVRSERAKLSTCMGSLGASAAATVSSSSSSFLAASSISSKMPSTATSLYMLSTLPRRFSTSSASSSSSRTGTAAESVEMARNLNPEARTFAARPAAAGAKGLERVVRTARMPAGATRARVARAATTVVAAARMVNPRLREWMRAMTVRTGGAMGGVRRLGASYLLSPRRLAPWEMRAELGRVSVECGAARVWRTRTIDCYVLVKSC
mmetsp:Transcript_9014/g.40605  ORF Transcript_9014/g.40605 Transcript_9014/m.40605 type:complete len:270 (+) Transcript_9014:1779-2588(+)